MKGSRKKNSMSIIINIGIVAGIFFLMEAIAWLTHKYVMHGFLWSLHKDHHEPHPGFFEKNDAFFLIFAVPSFFCIFIGGNTNQLWLFSIGLGIMLYGFAYFLVHEVLIHKRFSWFAKSENKYLRVVRLAHKMHHKHLGKDKGESFGMLLVHKKYYDRFKIRA